MAKGNTIGIQIINTLKPITHERAKYLLKKSCPSPDEFALKIEYDPQIVIAKPTRNSINVIKFS